MKPPRVLIIDDNAMNVELATFILTGAHFVVDAAGDAAQGLRQLRAVAPDLILMDMQMPDRDGLSLTRELKTDAATRHIVVVAFTAYAMKGDEAKLRAAGCDGYIAKPIDVVTFAASVRSYLKS